MAALIQNVRFALRMLKKNPGFAATAILIMALGIGANTAIFSVVHAVLLEPLPFRDVDRLVQVWHTPPPKSFPGMTRFAVSAGNFLDWQKQNSVFEAMTLYSGGRFDVTGAGKPESVRASRVSPEFFQVFGAQPLYGRAFSQMQGDRAPEREVVLSYRYWRSHYGAEEHVLEKKINLDGEPYTVVGIMGPAMTKPDFAQIWVPQALTDAEKAVRGEHHFLVAARMKAGVTLEQAQAEMNTISRRLEEAYPEDDKGWGAVVNSMREETVGSVRPALLMMLGAVAFVLLIACANVANLVLGRAYARRKEIAIRSAMGARRGRIIGQLLAETVTLSLLGGALGLLGARFGIQLLLKYFAEKLPRMHEIGLSMPVLWFALGLSLATGVLAGLIPALRMSNGNVNEALKQGLGRTDADSSGSKTRAALVVVEVALSLVLLTGAGLMIRSLWKLQKIDPGFDEKNVLTMDVQVNRKMFGSAAEEAQFFNRVLERVRTLPGVTAAGAVDDLPLQGGSNQPVAVEGRPAVALSEQPEVSVRMTMPGYFKTMRIPVLEGRDITEDDRADSAPVVVISQTMAKQFWPRGGAVGHHLKLSFYPEKERTIVGVVGDVKQDGLDTSAGVATLYWPAAQVAASPQGNFTARSMTLAVRTTVPPRRLAETVTNVVHEAKPDVPVDRVMTLEELVGETLTQRSFNMQLLGIFGALALVLCTVGIYSVLAYSVRRGMKEIGLRMAFGATKHDVLQVVLVRGMKPTMIGIAIGCIAALTLGQLVQSMVYGVSSRDVPTLVLAILLMTLVSLLASLIPAMRATQVSPLTVLREE
uniref:ABC transporter permease n=1 Tax=Terriglobus albidus TaxID=1592106 RepID=UPI0021DFFF4B|nr:ABC transporter permease [Terriglobus albidus]